MFRFCLELETLNLSNFTFNKDADLEHMLLGCKSLTTVFVNETNKNQVMQLVDDCNKIDFVVKQKIIYCKKETTNETNSQS